MRIRNKLKINKQLNFEFGNHITRIFNPAVSKELEITI
jgi:hypothetical protein